MVPSFQLSTITHLYPTPIRLSELQEHPIRTAVPYIQQRPRRDSSDSARHVWRTTDRSAEADPAIPHKADDDSR